MTGNSDCDIRVFLVDDDSRFRRAYRRLFEHSLGFYFAGEAGSAEDALHQICVFRPDVILLDIQMPGESGLELIRLLQSERLGSKIIVLTTFDLDTYVDKALVLGASGFMLKNASPQEVLHAVRAVQAGHVVLAPEVTTRVVRRAVPIASQSHPFVEHNLSQRELQVIRLVAQGYSNQEIADELYITSETVKTYLKRMFSKLGARDRTHLAILAHQAGLLHDPR